jgi:hypothetical protein
VFFSRRKARIRNSIAAVAVLTFSAVALAAPAGASHDPTLLQHVSTGPTDGNGNNPAQFRGASADGSRVFFTTSEKLTASDNDGTGIDVYQWSNGQPTLISTSQLGGNASVGAGWGGVSSDGAKVFFVTSEALTLEDTDTSLDVYSRFAGTTTLESVDASGANTPGPAFFSGSSEGGNTVVFLTGDQLVPEDVDSSLDIYKRSGGTTTWQSFGPNGGNGAFGAVFSHVSTGGSRVTFTTAEQLVSEDTDTAADVYQRDQNTTTTLLSSGQPSGESAPVTFEGAANGGGIVFFSTVGQLEASDIDSYKDIYQRAVIGVSRRVSTGPRGGNGVLGEFPAYNATSADGSRVFFTTPERITGDDEDLKNDVYVRINASTTELISRVFDTQPCENTRNPCPSAAEFGGISPDGSRAFYTMFQDLYEYTGGTTTQISVGGDHFCDSCKWTINFGGLSGDGSRIFFTTDEPFAAADTETATDVYENVGGTLSLVSAGPGASNGPFDAFYRATTPDGKRVYFDTGEPLLGSDTDSAIDIYAANSL